MSPRPNGNVQARRAGATGDDTAATDDGRQAVKSTTRVTIDSSGYDAVIFDLDGVVTQTAAVHAAAWKRLFDAYLAERAARAGTGPGGAPDAALRPFDRDADYARYVDGKPRYDGVRDFLASRGIELPTGDPSDPPSARPSAGSATARTPSSTTRSGSTASRRSRPRSSSSTSCATPGSGSASCRRARTRPWCWT